MLKNKKGLSTVVTTLIIVLLVLVAVGIIWGVVSNLLDKSSGSVSTGAQCLDVSLKATKVINVSGAGAYNVTIERSSTGSDQQVGAMVVLYNDDSNSKVVQLNSMFNRLDVLTEKIVTSINSSNKIKVTPYFIDDAGKEQICPTSTEYKYNLVNSSS